MEKILKNNQKLSIHTLIIVAIIFLAIISLKSDFSAVDVDNSISGGRIKQGLTDANHGDTILLAQGNYTGSNNTNLTINKNVTIQGNGSKDKIIIDARGLTRIFTIGKQFECYIY